MAETLTPRLGLIKPARDTLTPLDVDRLNLNSDRIDETQGALNVADGFTPAVADMFDGLIVKEKTSGKVWIAEKQTNGSFTKRWIKYPYFFCAYTPSKAIGASQDTWINFGWTTLSNGDLLNSGQADTASGFWKAPFKGLFQVRVNDNFGASFANQFRASVLLFGGVGQSANCEAQHHASVVGWGYSNMCLQTRVLTAGTVVSHQVFLGQGGANGNLYSTVEVTCIERLD